MNKGKISMSIQWSTEKLKQWRGEIEREKISKGSWPVQYLTSCTVRKKKCPLLVVDSLLK